MSADTKIDVEIKEEDKTDDKSDSGDWCVVLYNDEVHTFQEVIQWLMEFADHTKTKAENIAVVVDMRGEAACYTGSKDDCEEVKEDLEDKGLKVVVKKNTENG